MNSEVHYMGKPCKRGHDGLRFLVNSACVVCTKERAIRGYHSDPNSWSKRAKKWHKENREKSRAIFERYRESRPGYANHHNSLRRAAIDQRTPMWADFDRILEFYENCPSGMVVDHIVPLRGKLVSGLHVSWNLQYLTPEENSQKSNKWCPDD